MCAVHNCSLLISCTSTFACYACQDDYNDYNFCVAHNPKKNVKINYTPNPNACFAGNINLVLNSLTSPGMVAATLSTLAEGAKFAEIGKRDIWSPQRVAQERPDVSYQVVAIDFLPLSVLRSSFQRLADMLASEAITPVNALIYPFDSVVSAMRKLSQVRRYFSYFTAEVVIIAQFLALFLKICHVKTKCRPIHSHSESGNRQCRKTKICTHYIIPI